jgi:hypothetical protein
MASTVKEPASLDAIRKWQLSCFLEQDLKTLEQARTGLNHSCEMSGVYGYVFVGHPLREGIATALQCLEQSIAALKASARGARELAEESR